MFWKKKETSNESDRRLSLDLEELWTLRNQTKNQRHTINELKATISSYESNMDDIKKLKAQVRKQSEADLLINAFKSVGIIPDKRKGFDHFAEDARLRQIAGMRNIANESAQNRGGGSPYQNSFGSGTFGGIL